MRHYPKGVVGHTLVISMAPNLLKNISIRLSVSVTLAGYPRKPGARRISLEVPPVVRAFSFLHHPVLWGVLGTTLRVMHASYPGDLPNLNAKGCRFADQNSLPRFSRETSQTLCHQG